VRYDDIWIAGTGSALGDMVPVSEAVDDGRYAVTDAVTTGMISVSESEASPAELAVRAGRAAMRAARQSAAPEGTAWPGFHLHGASYAQGPDLWSAACAIAAQLVGPSVDGLSVQVDAMCNGSLAALEMAATVLSARPDVPAALVTAGDQFPAGAVNRWRTDSGLVMGDGAAAAVLRHGEGRLRLLSTASFTDGELAALHRPPPGGDPPGPLELRNRLRAFFKGDGLDSAAILSRALAGIRGVIEQALMQARCDLEDVRWVVPPFVGRGLFGAHYATPFGIDPARTSLDFGLRVGHCGAADQLIGLDHLLRGGLLRAGDRVMLVAEGSGLTFGCAVLQAG
jgi:3-oxoacyl-[acyl-carrier-protein] synthase III